MPGWSLEWDQHTVEYHLDKYPKWRTESRPD